MNTLSSPRFAIHRLTETTSTNDDAKIAADSGAAEGTVIWALQQRAGRGRQGREWHSPQGNLYFSIVLRPPTPKRDWGRYSFAVALAVSDLVRLLLPNVSIELKWPNDVLVNGKKICGILLESGEDWLIAGIGINVENLPENPLYPVTSLAAEHAAFPLLETLLNKALEALHARYDLLNQEGFAHIREAWLNLARKGPMRVRLPKGPEITEIQGEFADLDAEGNLCLRLPDGSQKVIHTGDVYF